MSAGLEEVPFDAPVNGTNGSHDFRIGLVRHALDTETTEESFRRIIAEIVEGRWVKQVQAVRDAYQAGGKDAAGAPKKNLPAVLFSGTFTRRAADALKQHSGLICVDLDDLGDRLPSIREAIEADPHTLCAFVSPTGTGLKVVFRCSPDQPHIKSFKAAERYCLEHFGLEIDPACKDVSRLCFVSFDPETFIAEHCELLPELPEAAEFKAPAEVKPGAQLTAGLEPWDDYDLRGDLPALLTQHGWTQTGKYGWTRPGKTSGISATWGKVPGRFYVFTSSTEFEANHTYKPWHVYAILNHGGNWKQAVAALRKEGFGAPIPQRAAPKSANHPTNAPEIYEPGYEEEARHGENEHEAGPTAEERKAKRESELLERLNSRRFDIAKRPPEPIPRFFVKGRPVSTPGNLTAVISQAKSGKTAVIGAKIAAAIAAHYGITDRDTLGITSSAPGAMRVIHMDNEQSIYDHDSVIRRELRRIGVDEIPPWLDSFCLTGFTPMELRQSLQLLLRESQAKGGVHSVILDGIADLCANVNDLAESNEIVTELHAAAIAYDCPIICVIHDNEGKDPHGDGRGHLGKQLMRKSESNLRLKKNGDVTVVFSEKMRRAPIFEKDGPTFSWSNDAKMHMLCGPAESPRDIAKAEKYRDLADGVFQHANVNRLRFVDFLKAISAVSGVGPSAAEDRFTQLKKLGLIEKDMVGYWSRKAH